MSYVVPKLRLQVKIRSCYHYWTSCQKSSIVYKHTTPHLTAIAPIKNLVHHTVAASPQKDSSTTPHLTATPPTTIVHHHISTAASPKNLVHQTHCYCHQPLDTIITNISNTASIADVWCCGNTRAALGGCTTLSIFDIMSIFDTLCHFWHQIWSFLQ